MARPQVTQPGRNGGALTEKRPGLGPVAALATAHAINDSYVYVLQALLPAIIPALGLTLGMAGVLTSLYVITSSFLQPFVGHIADRGNLRWPVWAGVALGGVAAGLLGQAPSYPVLALLLVAGGVGTAVFHPVASAMVGAAAPPRARGRWMGLFVTAGNTGMIFGPLALGMLLQRSGISGTWPIMGPALAAAVLVAIMAPRRSGSRRQFPPLSQIIAAHKKLLASLLLVVSLRSSANSALITFIPLLARTRGMGVAESAQLLSVYLVGVAVGGFLGGFAADRWGRDRVIVASLLLSLPFGLAVALRPDVDLLFYAVIVGSGFFLNASFVVLTIRGQESLPGSVGMVSGLTLGFSGGVGGLAVAPLAFLAEWIGLPYAAAVAVSLAALSAAAMQLLPPLPGRGAPRP